MSVNDDVARYYSALAPGYDHTAGYTDPVAEKLRQSIKTRYQQAFKDHDVLEVACGTGYWTQVVAVTARSVLAVDVNPSMIELARKRLSGIKNVRCEVADAYSLEGVPQGFSAAFAVWWWSHIPLSRIPEFLSALHRKLIPGAFVLFVDQLPTAYPAPDRSRDRNGNLVEQRTLDDGRSFTVVKNFPTEQELRKALREIAEDVCYRQYPDEHSWNLSYSVKK
jgi:ubiquinone/menaquinone biosynthesis C-methylase UbiE